MAAWSLRIAATAFALLAVGLVWDSSHSTSVTGVYYVLVSLCILGAAIAASASWLVSLLAKSAPPQDLVGPTPWRQVASGALLALIFTLSFVAFGFVRAGSTPVNITLVFIALVAAVWAYSALLLIRVAPLRSKSGLASSVAT